MRPVIVTLSWLASHFAQSLSNFQCTTQSACIGGAKQWSCDANSDCEILCNGPNACDQAYFICPPSANNCNVICDRQSDSDLSLGCNHITVGKFHSYLVLLQTLQYNDIHTNK